MTLLYGHVVTLITVSITEVVELWGGGPIEIMEDILAPYHDSIVKEVCPNCWLSKFKSDSIRCTRNSGYEVESLWPT